MEESAIISILCEASTFPPIAVTNSQALITEPLVVDSSHHPDAINALSSIIDESLDNQAFNVQPTFSQQENEFLDLIADLMPNLFEPQMATKETDATILEEENILAEKIISSQDCNEASYAQHDNECQIDAEPPSVGNSLYGTPCSTEDVKRLIAETKHYSDFEKIEAVNNFFNLMPYYSDLDHWGVEDYWATPHEFIQSGGGDCEDYALAKFHTLIEMGIPEDKLFLTYVFAPTAHMVLSFYPTPNSSPLILDNCSDRILPLNNLPYEPVFSINSLGIWNTNSWGLHSRYSDANYSIQWKEYQTRLKVESMRG
ncbi:transglutaminase-like cysteine peptidase [Candidatus Berkiella aquae]|uniref:Transglutaminase-like cysteine peptidase n=1 Tax=Candidatus Berkiella aquae TaxID=295108 RepID=A0A0Q9YEF5_9GAMM|nr:transglutaminase-like cysteine peptidase [Candidatus Berkiella aquae]MCS5711643.1 transglutaminase-like cysteine peptidase [Candidatus Berkiella aquae]